MTGPRATTSATDGSVRWAFGGTPPRQMTDHQPIASTEFIATMPDGLRRRVRVGVGVPTVGRLDVWWCPVWLDGLDTRVGPIAGEDALQALGLAWEFLGKMLGGFVAAGGRLEFPGGGDVPLTAYFGAAAAVGDAATDRGVGADDAAPRSSPSA